MIPLSQDETDERAYLSQPPWPISSDLLRGYTKEIEELFGIGHDSYEEIRAAAPAATGLIGPGGEDFVLRWAKCSSFKRRNIVSMLGKEIRESANLTVWLDATVTGFDLDRERGRLTAVNARSLGGRAITVAADEFVIAAGTIETTRLLLTLDAASDDRAFARTNALGRYFQDHLKAEIAVVDRNRPELTNRLLGYRFVRGVRRDLHLELSPGAQREDRVASAFIYVATDWTGSGLAAIKDLAEGLQRGRMEPRQVPAAVRDFGQIATAVFWRLRYRQLYVPAKMPFQLMACVEQLPDASNRIRLGEGTDRLGMRKARLEWRPQPAEEVAFQSTITRLGRFWQSAGLDQLCPLTWHDGLSKETVIVRAEACAHPSGSTRMGVDPSTSVVGPDLRCHAVPNLAIASASVFPTAGSANPTLTIMQLALRLSDSYARSYASTPRSAGELVGG